MSSNALPGWSGDLGGASCWVVVVTMVGGGGRFAGSVCSLALPTIGSPLVGVVLVGGAEEEVGGCVGLLFSKFPFFEVLSSPSR